MTAETRKPFKYKKLVIILSIVLAVILLFVSSFFIFIKVGEKKLRQTIVFPDNGVTDESVYGGGENISYNGHEYVYNENLINILCVGVDKYTKGGTKDRQADALFLLSLDTEKNTFNVIPISRNTLADIDIYDMNHEYMATENTQICLSYVYGKDDVDSTLLTCKAVSRLMYNLPINAYYTVFMDSIADIVDSVDGVEVIIPHDMTDVRKEWTKGKKVVLNSKNALRFLQHRGEEHGPRLERQKLFITSLVSKAKKMVLKDLTLAIEIYKKITKNSVTNIEFSSVAYLATEIANAKFQMHSIDGEVGFDGKHETFVVDDEALYETVLDLFYIKTK